MNRSALIAPLLALIGLAMPAAASAQSVCDAPQVLLTVDKSSSMLGTLPSGMTKWQAARTAIGDLTSSFSSRIDFGLQPFPYPNRCQPGAVTIDVGSHTSTEILAGLGDPPPSGGNYTPMAQTIDEAGDYMPLSDPTRDNHVILITDGWQWCDPYDPATRFDPVDAVSRLDGMGITVHVVGFGAAVDALTLNRAAVAAGTALPGCDSTATDPSDPNHCYMQADDLTELTMILDGIGTSITAEVCDGFDNDCDGSVDEGFDTDGDGVTTCDGDCDDSNADVAPGASEVCDGVDNDCDGSADPGCSCVSGDTQSCGSEVGACETGQQTCSGGSWGECTGGVSPAETDGCDGLDSDCDGEVDEDPDCDNGLTCDDGECVDLSEPTDPVDPPSEPTECEPGETRNCGSSVGACSFGTETCTPDGEWGECQGGIGPTEADLCDGIDGDCDGELDEDAACGGGMTCEGGMCVGEGEPTGDAGMPVGTAPTGVKNGGCGCASTGGASRTGGAAIAGLVALGLLCRRRRR